MATSFTEFASFDDTDLDIDSLGCSCDSVIWKFEAGDASVTTQQLTARRGFVNAGVMSAVSDQPVLPYIRKRGYGEINNGCHFDEVLTRTFRNRALDAGILGPNLDLFDWDLDSLGDLSFDDFDFSVLVPAQTGEEIKTIYAVVLEPLLRGKESLSEEEVNTLFTPVLGPYWGYTSSDGEIVNLFRNRSVSIENSVNAVEEIVALLRTWVWSQYDRKDGGIWTRYERPSQDVYSEVANGKTS